MAEQPYREHCAVFSFLFGITWKHFAFATRITASTVVVEKTVLSIKLLAKLQYRLHNTPWVILAQPCMLIIQYKNYVTRKFTITYPGLNLQLAFIQKGIYSLFSPFRKKSLFSLFEDQNAFAPMAENPGCRWNHFFLTRKRSFLKHPIVNLLSIISWEH